MNNRTVSESDPLIVLKMLDPDGGAPWGARGFKWGLPHGKSPGKTVTAKGPLIECQNGLHGFHGFLSLVRARLYAEHLYVAALWGNVVEGKDKVVASHGRLLYRMNGWNKCTARLFAADCAERTLPYFENLYPADNRPRLAIQAARRFAFAAYDAADRAAYSAADSAACSAAYSAAYNAADNAAYRAADKDKEQCWQAQRLYDYANNLVDIEAIRASVKENHNV